jgi:hypothetical protein
MRNPLAFAAFRTTAVRKGALAVCVALCTLGPGLSASDRKARIITFDTPGAGTGGGQGTVAFGINPAGAITGYYLDANKVLHGFLCAPGGTITTFDDASADINPQGAIAGYDTSLT